MNTGQRPWRRNITWLALLSLVAAIAVACATEGGGEASWTFGPTLAPTSAEPSAPAASAAPATSAAPSASAPASAAPAESPVGSDPPVASVGPGTSSAPQPSAAP